MGRDRQEKRLRENRRVESDRNQSLDYPGSTRLESTKESRERNK